jgi:hypothetical protein
MLSTEINTYEYRNDESLYLQVLRIHKLAIIHLNTSVNSNSATYFNMIFHVEVFTVCFSYEKIHNLISFIYLFILIGYVISLMSIL